MRVRDSGMPEESYWETLVDVPLTLARFNMKQYHDVAELGCGYGTFTVPVACAISGRLTTYDIDPAMVARTRDRAEELPVVCRVRDVMESGFESQVDAVLLFNILHCDDPVALLRHAARAGERVLVTHWQPSDTPRGPSLDIRPRPAQICDWAAEAGLKPTASFDLPPWHFGLELSRRPSLAVWSSAASECDGAKPGSLIASES